MNLIIIYGKFIGALQQILLKLEQKASLDDITVGLYLEKHPKLRKKYEDYGGYETIINAGTYVKEEILMGMFKSYENGMV